VELHYQMLIYTQPNRDILVNGGREYGEKIINNLSSFQTYGKNRDSLTKETTLLSAYLKFGNISVREVYHKMSSNLGKNSDLVRQLIWREFYAQLLYHNPQVLINWEEGEKYFARHLTDYDPASNNGNWQWVSSSGADSQPYFRIFNPWSQSEKHDPNGEYIKKWIPELEDVPAKSLHKWYDEYKKFQNIKYPEPVVDYELQRKKALEMYKRVV